MSGLFRSKSCGHVGLTDGPFFHRRYSSDVEDNGGEEEEEFNEEDDEDDIEGSEITKKQIPTPFISPESSFGGEGRNGNSTSKSNHFTILDILVGALRKSLVTCGVETDDVSPMDISWPTEVRHVSHVTFDRFNGFLGLPTEFEPEVPRKALSASASVFGVSAESMQCSYDERGNSVPIILLMMQKRLYSSGGLKAEGIFRINAENGQDERVRDQLNKGIVPHGIDVHCLAGLIKAWLRELPTGVLDSLSPEQVVHCNSEENCTQLVKLLPRTESDLLDWAINLMADVVEHEQYNKMNARNLAMVFAPNMTQMADPLTALIHAVQVMNFLKTLILKTLREREESAIKSGFLSSSSDSFAKSNSNLSTLINLENSRKQAPDAHDLEVPATLSRLESGPEEKLWTFQKSDGEEEFESVISDGTPEVSQTVTSENGCKGGNEKLDRLGLRKGVSKLCRHPVFQLSKVAKKTRNLGIVNTRGSGEACT
ncbi:hypothetical protein SLEP1_g2205 [Rubroshorea leprosula]|uniref:Rho-GAP domain-containing protein n=1 Tax=Rubroshorea leprosula TaxID=152421 RepID=A0AAV5HPP0_9ROSI|nr:hypothetical protein SLEP1_g2205 [Rubroshorea leprosula]